MGRLKAAPTYVEAGFRRPGRADGMTMIELLVFSHDGFLSGRLIDQPVLPFAGFAIITDWSVERCIATEAAIHVDNVLFRDAKALGDELDLIRTHIAFVKRGNLALRLPQVEEQFLLVRGCAHLHKRPRTQDILLY